MSVSVLVCVRPSVRTCLSSFHLLSVSPCLQQFASRVCLIQKQNTEISNISNHFSNTSVTFRMIMGRID